MNAKRLYRSNTNKVLAGVCGGVGEYFDVDPVIIRLAWALLSLLSLGTGILIYVIAIAIIPKEGEEKGSSGCLIALLVLAGAFVIIPIVLSLIGGLFFGTWHILTAIPIEIHNALSPFGFIGTVIGGLIGLAVLTGIIFLIVLLVSRSKKK